MHGTVIDVLPNHQAIVRNDAVPMMLPPSIRRYTLVEPPGSSLHAGVELEGLVDPSPSPPRIVDAIAAAPFSPGVPDPGHVEPADLGKPWPHAHLVDADGEPLDLATRFLGRTVILSFIFTRCPDRTLCPAISGKFAYLQSHLDPQKFALVEITLDPPYDSPRVLHAYGDQFGAKRGAWYLLTGTGTVVKRVLDEFGINSLRVSAANFIHSDRLFIATAQGRTAFMADSADWDPDAVVSEASAISGAASNPFERFKLSLVANVVALCGGSASSGIAILETVTFGIICTAVMSTLWWIGRRLWTHKA
jgi:protein SCO1/2